MMKPMECKLQSSRFSSRRERSYGDEDDERDEWQTMAGERSIRSIEINEEKRGESKSSEERIEDG